VAADYVLMPVFDYLDVPIVPRPPDRTIMDESAVTAALEDDDDDEYQASTSRVSVRPSRRSTLSVATAIALDFEEKFNWALVKMLICEAHGHREVQESQSHKEVKDKESQQVSTKHESDESGEEPEIRL